MDLQQRLRNLEACSDPPEGHILYWRFDLGETEEQAIERYKRENNIKEFDNIRHLSPYILKLMTDDQIRAERKEEKEKQRYQRIE